MKKFILFALACSILFSCKKEHTNVPASENSQQVLTRIIKTADYGGATYSIVYAYNTAGKLIKEGDITYERDNMQRIVRILGSDINRNDIQVYYDHKKPDQVDYTFCTLANVEATDSVVYLHDNNGRLIKTISYVTFFSDPYVPAIPLLSEYKILSYDANGNMSQADVYEVDYNGREVQSGKYFFINYDKSKNPLYTGDEVRATDFSCGSFFKSFYGIINNSMNNFTSINNYYNKLYEYRADGRPKSCLVQQNGNNIFKLLYEYK